ncbi:MAG TPA: hypothetical protein VMS75_10850 [Terriglobales bacterium]|nr:hypothetical protein [Terriglobales bacterium]
MTEEAQSGYYQAIAREFLRRRGAPFFLSPRDLAVISGWESDGIPLRVVLEGVGRAFENRRDRARGTKGLPLAFCDAQVRKAMAQHADRGAGRRRSAATPRSEKADLARREVERSLRGPAAGEPELRALLEKAAALLAAEPADEAALEAIDEAVDGLLWRRTGRVRPAAPPAAAAARTRSVKEERRKLRIPYVSLFYY